MKIKKKINDQSTKLSREIKTVNNRINATSLKIDNVSKKMDEKIAREVFKQLANSRNVNEAVPGPSSRLDTNKEGILTNNPADFNVGQPKHPIMITYPANALNLNSNLP